MLNAPWPGHVRELKHCLERACAFCEEAALSVAPLFRQEPPEGNADAESLSAYLEACERRYIEQILRENAGRVGETASALGICRKTLWAKMKKLNLKPLD